MLTCPNPTCRKPIAALERECPRCRTDLSLLVDYVDHLQGGLSRAEALARAGELGDAVWAYLEVLEVDPDNAEARRQVGRVAAAVRQFDRAAPGRRWFHKVQREVRSRDWLHALAGEESVAWIKWALAVVVLLVAFVLGYEMGRASASRPTEDQAVVEGQ
jgi:hypothetical protein